jgi:hypothetical protein
MLAELAALAASSDAGSRPAHDESVCPTNQNPSGVSYRNSSVEAPSRRLRCGLRPAAAAAERKKVTGK